MPGLNQFFFNNFSKQPSIAFCIASPMAFSSFPSGISSLKAKERALDET
jgi:hypothetical protein